jgi:hypothetical protein
MSDGVRAATGGVTVAPVIAVNRRISEGTTTFIRWRKKAKCDQVNKNRGRSSSRGRMRRPIQGVTDAR